MRPTAAWVARARTSSAIVVTVPRAARPPASRIRPPRPTAARSERATSSLPAARTFCAPGSTETIRSVTEPTSAPRPPITYASPPIAAAAAWVVAAGSVPSRRTEPEAGSNPSTAALAVPAGSEPPAIITVPPTEATAAYRTALGRCATTWAAPPGFQARIVSSQRVPVYPPTT